ncbi:MAG: hypothetical protein LM576_01070 [Thermofilum sp.]|nr:hypothetical protein [Thermofilum sp.]
MAEKELLPGLTPRVLVLLVLITAIYYIPTLYLWNLSDRPYTFSGGFIGYFWIVMFLFFLGRLSPKLRLTKQEAIVLMVPFWILTGISFIEKGTPNEGLCKGWSSATGLVPLVYALNVDPYKEAWANAFPSFWIPSEPELLRRAWEGLGIVDWGPWIAPMIYWALFWVSWVVIGLCWGFIFRRPMVEVERLPFVAGLPLSYFTKTAFETTGEGKSRLFDFGDSWTRMMWIGFLVGLLLSLAPVIYEIWPVIPFGAWWGEYPIDYITHMTEPVLPGADFSFVFHITQIVLWLMISTDVLVTAIVSWLAINVIYNAIVVRAGLVPFEPGISSFSCWTIGYRPPFHYSWFGTTGVLVGVGIWTFVTAWPHIKKVFSTLKGEDYVEQGQSMRAALLLLIAFTVIWGALWAAAGIPVHLYIVFYVLWLLWIVASTRMVGEVWYHMPVGTPLIWPYIYYLGAATGFWQAVVPNTNPLAIRSMFLVTTATWWTPRFQSNSMFMSQIGYRVAQVNDTRAGDMFKALLITSIVGILVAVPFGTWFMHHYGGLSSFTGDNWEGGGVAWATGAENIVSSEYWPVGYDITTHIVYTIVGAAVTIGLYMARARWPWFMINPAALSISLWLNEYMWMNAVVALIIKLVITRVGGVKALEEKVLPAVVGFCTGYGALFLFVALREIFLKVLPKAMGM